MGRLGRGCCCVVNLLVIAVVVGFGWSFYHANQHTIRKALAAQIYIQQYSTVLSDYSDRIDKIKSEPAVQSALTSAQRHAKHIREMKQITDAQDACEHALNGIKPPPELAAFHSAVVEYTADLSKRYHKFEKSLQRNDVPQLNKSLHSIDEQAESAAERVDRSLAQVPHYEQGKQKLEEYWAQLRKAMESSAPPLKNGMPDI